MQTDITELFPIFKFYPKLKESMPLIPLGKYPTPVHRLPEMEKCLDFPEIWIKRDDKSSEIYSGNKVRMFEFILGYALKQNRKTLLSWGSIGSNQILASIMHSQNMPLDVEAIMFKQPVTDHVLTNMKVDHNLDANLHYAGGYGRFALKIMLKYLSLLLKGRKPFLVPYLFSSVPSVLGYVNAMYELKEQIDRGELPEPDYIFITVGTGGTYCGIELGARMIGLKSKIIGTRITEKIVCNEYIMSVELNRTIRYMRKLGYNLPVKRYSHKDIIMDHGQVGKGYGEATDACLDAKCMLLDYENITADQTYTAKTLATMISYIRNNIDKSKKLLFWHTLNSVDLTPLAGTLSDYDDMPSVFHKFFKELYDN